MCDYSLTSVQSRPARVGDRLLTHNFGTGTIGFRAATEPSNTAVCVLPGTEIAFDMPPRKSGLGDYCDEQPTSKVATFRQINRNFERMHHDALEFPPEGKTVLLTTLREGQAATVLQLPVAPKTEQEAKDQQRVPWVEHHG